MNLNRLAVARYRAIEAESDWRRARGGPDRRAVMETKRQYHAAIKTFVYEHDMALSRVMRDAQSRGYSPAESGRMAREAVAPYYLH